MVTAVGAAMDERTAEATATVRPFADAAEEAAWIETAAILETARLQREGHGRGIAPAV